MAKRTQAVTNEQILEALEVHGTFKGAAKELGISTETIRTRRRGEENAEFCKECEEAVFNYYKFKSEGIVDKAISHLQSILDESWEEKDGRKVSTLTPAAVNQVIHGAERIMTRGKPGAKAEPIEGQVKKESPVDVTRFGTDTIKKILEVANESK